MAIKYRCYKCKKLFNKNKVQTWNVCSDGNKKRLVCTKCDIELNEMVLKFIGFRNWKSKIKKYKEKMNVNSRN